MSDQSYWQEFLLKVDKLTAVSQRAIAAVMGALIADAACKRARACVCMHISKLLLSCVAL